MRHSYFGNHLGRDTNQARALRRSLVHSVLFKGRIETTRAKALSVRPELERVINLSRVDNVNNRRQMSKILGTNISVKRAFNEVGPAFKDVTSGFTRIIRLGDRMSDMATMVILELTRMPIFAEVVKPEAKEEKTVVEPVEKKVKKEVKKLAKPAKVKGTKLPTRKSID